jgi:predicted O-methyltransferase YrrM
MSQDLWTAVDQYFDARIVCPDAALEATLAASAAAGLPSINVTPSQGKLLQLLARMIGARQILEIGTLGGYSTIWLARGLSGGSAGRVVTLEIDEKHAAVARGNIARAGLADRVELILGRAIESLPRLASPGREKFDLIFIDADKVSTGEYFSWAIQLSRPGSVIVVDNVVRKGAIIDAASSDASVQAIRRFTESLSSDPRVTATVVQTVGSKGYDGFIIAIVN